jgi:hypothetical protein
MHGYILVSLAVTIGGAIAHLLTEKGKTLGLWAFGIGLFWTLSTVAGEGWHIGR